MHTGNTVDAVVIGGGFYGSVIAIYLARRGLRRILLVEREARLMQRASYNNQARVHNGYHYPRSYTTAYRSRINLPRFVRDWPLAIKQDFTKLYAVGRRNSKVTAKQFDRFCKEIGAPIRRAAPALRGLFEPRLIEEVFEVEEYAFDSAVLARWAESELEACQVHTRLKTCATAIRKTATGLLSVSLSQGGAVDEVVDCHYVFNCSYSGLNQLQGDFAGTQAGLKQEITELALVKAPPVLAGVGITVVDGPFFSLMPFPARKLHTLSHVRYTPHQSWPDIRGLDPYQRLGDYDCATRVDRMVRDVARYLPAVREVAYQESLFEVKTVLMKNESDDGRPILFQRHEDLPGCYSILGGKIDNIYDVLEKLDAEPLQLP